MPDNVIRLIVLLLVPVLLAYAVLVAACLAVAEVWREVTGAMRDPQDTRFTHWKFWV
jgi:hypothetical protein